MEIDSNAFAKEWIESWNSHDINKILSHYSDDFEITTPMIKVALGLDTGTLSGKQHVRKYWETALNKIPDLHFELKEVTTSVNSIAIYYKSVMDKMAIEVMFFNDQGKVNKVIAHYAN
jgi:ketosteroid isomerase-like protein